jgi:hypothetical protein
VTLTRGTPCIFAWDKTSALVHLINYQPCNLILSVELKNDILETNSHLSMELLISALGDLTMGNLTYIVHLLQHKWVIKYVITYCQSAGTVSLVLGDLNVLNLFIAHLILLQVQTPGFTFRSSWQDSQMIILGLQFETLEISRSPIWNLCSVKDVSLSKQ